MSGDSLATREDDGRWKRGASPNPGGRPKALRDIEDMLNADHRTAENMRQVFARLRVLAMGEVVEVAHRDGTVIVQLKAIPDFMRLYLERVLGPVKEVAIDLSDVPDDELRVLREKLHGR